MAAIQTVQETTVPAPAQTPSVSTPSAPASLYVGELGR